ncbi:AbrB/MazE/SpoVT family DNA-binding domain-containing protein [Candidatus Woesearchaeota archaeon]|nr:AbrB/MazE/SpoVT family DNA-binding domain-containing protein [Candidatus Woesearchaeota archaeon]
MAESKVKKWGNSLGIIIPKDIVKIEEVNEGDIIKVDIIKEKKISGFGIFKGAPPYKEEEEGHEEFW